MRVLAFCGSLRAVSSNAALLRAAAIVAPADTRLSFYDGLADLPHFNPDVEVRGLPPSVAELRALIAAADAIVISSPEYAHGVPGSLKNALDWLVSGIELPGKPVAFFNASPTAAHAPVALREILTTMSARVIDAAEVTLPLGAKRLDAAGMAADPGIAAALRAGLGALAAAVRARGAVSP